LIAGSERQRILHLISGHVTQLPSSLPIPLHLLKRSSPNNAGKINYRPRELLCTMDAQNDIHLTRGDFSHNTLTENFAMDHANEPGNTALNEDLVPDNLSSPSSNVSHV
jgi:hypothetical protein